MPTHEIAFQIPDGEEVRFNEFSRAPLLRAFEWVETLFKPLNTEQEFQAWDDATLIKIVGPNRIIVEEGPGKKKKEFTIPEVLNVNIDKSEYVFIENEEEEY